MASVSSSGPAAGDDALFAGGEEAGEVAVARRRERERRRAKGGGAAGKPACFFFVFLVRCVWSVVSFFWRAAETRIAERRRPGGEDTGEEESRGRGLEVEEKKNSKTSSAFFLHQSARSLPLFQATTRFLSPTCTRTRCRRAREARRGRSERLVGAESSPRKVAGRRGECCP